MNKPAILQFPFTAKDVRRLRVGDMLLVCGRVFTGRDKLHKHIFDGHPLPAYLKNGAIYHCGPVVVREAGRWIVKAAGPTTSMREEPYMAEVLRRTGLRLIIGKGGMGIATARACARLGCAYLEAVGGAAQVLADRVVSVRGVSFLSEFGPAEAMWELELDRFPAIVAIDAGGASLRNRIERQAINAFKRLLATRGVRR